MTSDASVIAGEQHSHVFLGAAHARNERKAWAVIALCSAMMVLEIAGGIAFGSLALVADGLHMSTHATALLIAALAYTFARRHVSDPRFTFGTGKLGDLAGFSSAIVLAMIALLIGYEAVTRFLAPVHIAFREAIPIAVLGLLVNIVSAWLLRDDHDHGHVHADHADDHSHPHDHVDAGRDGETPSFVPLPKGARPRAPTFSGRSERSAHAAHADHNLRSAFVHVAADAVVSVLAIVGLLCARYFGWVWMDPAMGIIGSLVIAWWAYTLMRASGRILLDMTPDSVLAAHIRRRMEADGDRLTDFHLWRLGPGHFGAILSIVTTRARDVAFYRAALRGFPSLSHLTVEIIKGGAPG
jgi:cation diffusion facilitator family transporter